MVGGERAPVMIIGNTFADAVGRYWPYFAAYLGALGSFFSGSATISNLTFGGIQTSIAQNLMLDITAILSLQSVGAAMGNDESVQNWLKIQKILKEFSSRVRSQFSDARVWEVGFKNDRVITTVNFFSIGPIQRGNS